MKKLKLSIQLLQQADVLTRTQLKKILGGDDGTIGTIGDGDDSGHGTCQTAQCTVYDQETGITHHGNCGYAVSGRWGYAGCECLSDLGFYNPSGGSSSCWVP